MNRRKMFMLAMVGALMVLCSGSAFGVAQFHDCKVLQVGVQSTSYFVQFGDKTTGSPLNDTRNGFYGISMTNPRCKEFLAVLLTAMNMNKIVQAKFDWGVASPIEAVTLTQTNAP